MLKFYCGNQKICTLAVCIENINNFVCNKYFWLVLSLEN